MYILIDGRSMQLQSLSNPIARKPNNQNPYRKSMYAIITQDLISPKLAELVWPWKQQYLRLSGVVPT